VDIKLLVLVQCVDQQLDARLVVVPSAGTLQTLKFMLLLLLLLQWQC